MTPEALIGSIGIRKLLGDTTFKVLKQEVDVALRTDKDIRKLCQDFVAGEDSPIPEPLTFADLDWIKPALRNLDVQTFLQEVLPSLDHAGINPGIGLQIGDLLRKLQEYLPKNSILEEGLITTQPPKASISEDMRLLWVCRIVDNPLCIIHLMQHEQLTGRDRDIHKNLFPELHTLIINEMIATIIQEVTPDQHMPRSVKIPLSILLQEPVISSKTLVAYKQPPEKPPTDSPNVSMGAQT